MNPDPVTVTLAPIVPEVGLNEDTTGLAAIAGDAETTTIPSPTTKAPSAQAAR